MPSVEMHIRQAIHNHNLIEYLKKTDKFPDWLATVAFYEALHLVEAIFATQLSKTPHGGNHERREQILKRNSKFKKIYTHYRKLWNASIVARYLTVPGKGSGITFCNYMSLQDVCSILIGHELHQLRKSAKKFLSKSHVKLLENVGM